VGGPRGQAGDKEKVVCLTAAGAAEDWLARREDEGLRLVLVLLPIVTVPQQEEAREERGEIIKRRELLFYEQRSYLFIYPARPPAYSS